jgi:hypothetical protein
MFMLGLPSVCLSLVRSRPRGPGPQRVTWERLAEEDRTGGLMSRAGRKSAICRFVIELLDVPVKVGMLRKDGLLL